MEIIEEGNSKDPNWSLEINCTGAGWDQNNKRPCYSKLKLSSSDIVRRDCEPYGGSREINYGFICTKCKCFTEISEEKIPGNIKKFCLTVASKGSDDYSELKDEEKLLSEDL